MVPVRIFPHFDRCTPVPTAFSTSFPPGARSRLFVPHPLPLPTGQTPCQPAIECNLWAKGYIRFNCSFTHITPVRK